MHTTKDGKKIKLADLESSHLENIIKWIERKAKEGLTVIIGSSGSMAEDMWGDVVTYYGKEVEDKLNYYAYKSEQERRKNAGSFCECDYPNADSRDTFSRCNDISKLYRRQNKF